MNKLNANTKGLLLAGIVGLVIATVPTEVNAASVKGRKSQFIGPDSSLKGPRVHPAKASSVAAKKKAVDKELWKKPTGGEYPKVTADTDLRIVANITDQRIYFYDKDQLIYTMVTSSGLADEENATPLGDFEIQEIRGKSFFNSELGEGALNYVSFKDYGVYLFHSVPVNEQLEVNVAEAEKLGKRASHGCFRLSLPDSEWFYDTIMAGTPVKVTE